MIAVDTNIISLLLRGSYTSLPSQQIFIPYVVSAELYAGVASGGNPKKYKTILDSFFEGQDVTNSPGISTEVRNIYVDIYTYLRKNGTPVSPNDLWIAAECDFLSLPLLTKDKDFDHIPHVQKVAWPDET